jgi:hypothetical protein
MLTMRNLKMQTNGMAYITLHGILLAYSVNGNKI